MHFLVFFLCFTEGGNWQFLRFARKEYRKNVENHCSRHSILRMLSSLAFFCDKVWVFENMEKLWKIFLNSWNCLPNTTKIIVILCNNQQILRQTETKFKRLRWIAEVGTRYFQSNGATSTRDAEAVLFLWKRKRTRMRKCENSTASAST